MENTLLIQVNNPNALRLIKDLEKLNMLKVLKNKPVSEPTKLSDKYKGVFSKEDAKDFDEHIEKMRNEWDHS